MLFKIQNKKRNKLPQSYKSSNKLKMKQIVCKEKKIQLNNYKIFYKNK